MKRRSLLSLFLAGAAAVVLDVERLLCAESQPSFSAPTEITGPAPPEWTPPREARIVIVGDSRDGNVWAYGPPYQGDEAGWCLQSGLALDHQEAKPDSNSSSPSERFLSDSLNVSSRLDQLFGA